MLESAQAVRFVRRIYPGKTRPALVAVVDSLQVETEVIVKISEGCAERKVGGLVAEAIAAMLAQDLRFPIPKPFLTEFSPAFVRSIADREIQTLAMRSSRIGFGSQRLPSGYRAWIPGSPITSSLLGLAARIFAFDLLIDNIDRRVSNSNILTDGTQIAIYDHELAFVSNLILGGYRPPWEIGSREDYKNPDRHVLYEGLRGRTADFDLSTFATAWRGISDEKLKEYKTVIPADWANDLGVCNRAIAQIAHTRDNIDGCLAEVTRVLQ